jgi:hypothetical protein
MSTTLPAIIAAIQTCIEALPISSEAWDDARSKFKLSAVDLSQAGGEQRDRAFEVVVTSISGKGIEGFGPNWSVSAEVSVRVAYGAPPKNGLNGRSYQSMRMAHDAVRLAFALQDPTFAQTAAVESIVMSGANTNLDIDLPTLDASFTIQFQATDPT